MSFEVDDWPYLRHTFMIDPSYPINATSGFNGAEAGGGYAVSNYLDPHSVPLPRRGLATRRQGH